MATRNLLRNADPSIVNTVSIPEYESNLNISFKLQFEIIVSHIIIIIMTIIIIIDRLVGLGVSISVI